MLTNDTIYNIERRMREGEMVWQVLHPDTDKMMCFSETYDGAVKAAQELSKPFDDPLIKLREGVNYELLGRVVAERARRRDEVFG